MPVRSQTKETAYVRPSSTVQTVYQVKEKSQPSPEIGQPSTWSVAFA